MKTSIKIAAFIIALVSSLSCFASGGGGVVCAADGKEIKGIKTPELNTQNGEILAKAPEFTIRFPQQK